MNTSEGSLAEGGQRNETRRRLLENVRPPDWENPEPADRYDLAVIGAGTGGLVSAAIASALGARVALIERDWMGGDCLNFGCVPSKAMLRAARSWAEARASAERFGGPAVSGSGDFAAAMDRVRSVRADISDADAAGRFASMGVDVFFGEACFDSKDSLVIDDRVRLMFRRAILATGTRPAIPPVEGLSDCGYLTNETVFELDRLPARLLVLGAGPIGCELSQAFVRFGSVVTLIDRADRILSREEAEAAGLLLAALRRDGIEFVGGAEVTRVERTGAGVRLIYEEEGTEKHVEGDGLLVATGRLPNLDMNLDTAGIGHDARGVKVDDRLRTSNKRIYAVGDVVDSPFKFTHAADAHARLAVRNALFFGRGKVDDLVIPWVTYTSPEVARVGLSPAEARERDVDVETIAVALEDVDRARLDGESNGVVRIHLRRGSDEIVGATIVGGHAGDLISQVAQAMTLGIGLEKFSEVVFPYPTMAEALRKAADARRRDRLTPTARRAFELFFRVWRRFA